MGPAGAGIWSSPTVDVKKQRVYVTTANSTADPVAATSDAIVAFDMKSGKMLWSYQGTTNDGWNLACDLPDPYRTNCPSPNGPDFDFGSSAILVELAGGHRALIAGQKSAVVHAIDPDAGGKVLWKRQIGKGGKVGGVQWGPATDGGTVYVALSDAQLAVAPAKTGRIIWDTDTKQEFKTVNGVAAHGGSLNGPGPVIAGGVLYVNSGYVHIGTAPGNVLLAYSVNGR